MCYPPAVYSRRRLYSILKKINNTHGSHQQRLNILSNCSASSNLDNAFLTCQVYRCVLLLMQLLTTNKQHSPKQNTYKHIFTSNIFIHNIIITQCILTHHHFCFCFLFYKLQFASLNNTIIGTKEIMLMTTLMI